MLGLFCRSYDYYEWNDLVAVSELEEKLIKKYNELETEYRLIEKSQYEAMRDSEQCHYAIIKVDFIM